MANLNPYLSFNGDARAAMEHYRDVFGGELELRTFAEFGQTEGGIGDLIMHSTLSAPDGMVLMGADNPPPREYAAAGNISVILHGEDADALHRYWEGLSAGARIDVPLEPQMWGDEYGSCTDPYGIVWQVNITPATQ